MVQLGRQSKTALRIASLYFELCTFAPAAPEQFESAWCRNPNHPWFHLYGGKGVTVCDRWRIGENGVHGFDCFLRDVGRRPSRRHQLRRIDPDGDYEPGNVVWGPPARIGSAEPPRRR